MNSIKNRALMVGAAVVGFVVLGAAPAAAQATRTWVSGVGDDANPCSRTAPCKTFAGAISKTAAGGEINCIDPGGFGAVTITKSMTIQCDDVEAGVLVAGSPGITINAGATDVVTISGLDILGPTPSTGGTNGINFLNGAGVNIRHVTIKGFNTNAINFQPQSGTAFMNVDDVEILGNGTTGDATTGAVRIAPANSTTANVVVTNTRIQGNVNVGLRFDLTGTTGTRINAQVANSTVSNNGVGMLLKGPAGTGTINLMATQNVISGNNGTGVFGNGSGVGGRFALNTITANGSNNAAVATGVNAGNGSVLQSFGNNFVGGNFNSSGTAADGAFSGTIPPM